MPLSADYHGYVDLQSLARRTSRAIVHFMQVSGLLETPSFTLDSLATFSQMASLFLGAAL